MPSGIPTITARVMVMVARPTVGPRCWARRVVTGTPAWKIDWPRSPRRVCESQIRNCWWSGRCRPSSLRIVSKVSLRPYSPARTAAGSLGPMWLSRNTTTVTTAATGMVASSFLTTYSATPVLELMGPRDTEGGPASRRAGAAGLRTAAAGLLGHAPEDRHRCFEHSLQLLSHRGGLEILGVVEVRRVVESHDLDLPGQLLALGG